MRIIHVLVAIGIALIANRIESIWLGILVLLTLLGAYTYIVIAIQKRN